MHVTTDRWTASTAFPAENEVRVWEIDLEVPPFPVSELLGHMTLEERARAERFRVARAYHQFVTTRGLLRLMLGRYFGMPPADVPITYSGVGKPVVAGLPASPHFNVSHTDGLALIAFAHRPVGVDVERIRVMDDPEGLVARFFSQAESERYRSLDPGRQPAGFFRGWTCKEAVLKAAGLSVGFLDEFERRARSRPSRRAPRSTSRGTARPRVGACDVDAGLWLRRGGRRQRRARGNDKN